jgi:hypothetical protein
MNVLAVTKCTYRTYSVMLAINTSPLGKERHGCLLDCWPSPVESSLLPGTEGLAGHAVGWLVEALCYQLEGRGFKAR